MTRKARASVQKAKIGLATAPWIRGRERSWASKSLIRVTRATIRTTPLTRRTMTQPAAIKRRATAVMIEPEAKEAHLFRPRPRAASENPQTAPRMTRPAN